LEWSISCPLLIQTSWPWGRTSPIDFQPCGIMVYPPPPTRTGTHARAHTFFGPLSAIYSLSCISDTYSWF
jgi:hypothetical protein